MGSIGCEDLVQWEKAEEGEGDGSAGAGAGGGKEGERILVSVRLRPLSAKEIERNDPSDWACINNNTIIYKNSLPDRSMYPTAYTFDRVFGVKCSSRDVYEEGAKEVALSVVSGINATVFAYGQTSSGKTYTMTGITEYSVADIYDFIKKHQERAFILKFSAMEIYNEAVRDLLSMDSSPLRLLDDPERGTIVEKLTEETLRDQNHLKELLSLCEAQRQIGETSLNEMSSRSHQILRLTIESSARDFANRNIPSTLAATVNFVDLAGSERASQASSAGARLKEGCHINRSLLTLGTVIRKLSKGRTGHIPYRDSKLTRILQSSLGGNARTAVICTLSPARSHVEQSRNTLLFASCAKQVVTNAQVNVVMSDKELVKHLQRELARLESELRDPGSTSCASHFEALRIRDSQIEKMEREIKELVQQRDLAQSRVEDLLRAVGNDPAPRQWDESSRPSTSHEENTPEDECSISGTSGIAYQSPDFCSKRFCRPHEDGSLIEPHMEFSDKLDGEQDISPRHSVSSSTFSGMILQNRRDNKFEVHCKEVRCIEIHTLSTITITGEEFDTPSAQEIDHLPSHEESAVAEDSISESHRIISDSSPSVEQPKKSITKTTDDAVKPCLGESSPQYVMPEINISRGSTPTISRSCEASPNTASSFWSEDAEQHHGIPETSDFLSEFPNSPTSVAAEIPEMEHDDRVDPCSYQESRNSQKISAHMVEAQDIRITAEEDFSYNKDQFSEEMSQSHYPKDLLDDQETQQEEQVEEMEADKTVKDVGVDSVVCSVESSSRWSFDFESKQQEIIKLWHACNASLVHRTYFFLLFKGDPADSFYMEVERRRLSFLLKNTSHGQCYTAAADEGHSAMLSSSLKCLRREREMLCRQMNKKLSMEERIMLYTRWGISLDSKQRRMQIARRLWTKTDMAHIRESASLVAKLIGLLEQGEALREMFGLSFIPRRTNHRYFSWTHRKSSLP